MVKSFNWDAKGSNHGPGKGGLGTGLVKNPALIKSSRPLRASPITSEDGRRINLCGPLQRGGGGVGGWLSNGEPDPDQFVLGRISFLGGEDNLSPVQGCLPRESTFESNRHDH